MNQKDLNLINYSKQYKSRKTNVNCKICNSKTLDVDKLDYGKICGLNKHFGTELGIKVPYRKCEQCNFIFTDFFDGFSPEMWTTYIYNADYYDYVDPDYLLKRPKQNASQLNKILKLTNINWIGLDYGGGNGLLSELLKSKGHNYDCYDPYDQNTMQFKNIGKYNFLTAFEVAEHSPDPVGLLNDALSFCDPVNTVILIGTEISDNTIARSRLSSWWYAAPRNGHISLYSKKSLTALAEKNKLKYYKLSNSTHIFIRGYSPLKIIKMIILGKILNKIRVN